ncbi:unnamed protein product, partial [Staurois parvus]
MAQCADMFRETIRHDIWRQRFTELFLACDAAKIGFLDRQRVLALLEIFYDRIITEVEEWQPRNPRQWPVIEIGEMDPTDFWVDFQEGVNPTEEKGEKGEAPTTATSIISTESVHAVEELKKSAGDTGEGTTENEQAPQAEDNGSRGSQNIEEKPWSGDLLTSDLAIRYSSYGDRNQDECQNTVSKFTDLYNIISDINTRGPSRIPSAFNGKALNLPQFVQLMETFVGDAPLSAVENLTSFIQKEYVETEEERIALLAKVHQDALIARQKLVLQALFEKWDNDGSGFLELKEVDGVLIKYKEGMESEAMAKGKV